MLHILRAKCLLSLGEAEPPSKSREYDYLEQAESSLLTCVTKTSTGGSLPTAWLGFGTLYSLRRDEPRCAVALGKAFSVASDDSARAKVVEAALKLRLCSGDLPAPTPACIAQFTSLLQTNTASVVRSCVELAAIPSCLLLPLRSLFPATTRCDRAGCCCSWIDRKVCVSPSVSSSCEVFDCESVNPRSCYSRG